MQSPSFIFVSDIGSLWFQVCPDPGFYKTTLNFQIYFVPNTMNQADIVCLLVANNYKHIR